MRLYFTGTIFSVLLLLIGCTSLFEQPDYTTISKKSGNSENTRRSEFTIDKSLTFEFFFILPMSEKKIKLQMQAEEISDRTGSSEKLQPFFIAEKYYSVSVDSQKLDSYTEIGANHNSDWTIIETVEIQSQTEDPLVQLSPGVYRFRFTVFSDRPFRYAVTFHSNSSQLLFASTLSDAKGKLAASQAALEEK